MESVDNVDKLTRAVERLSEQVEKLQRETSRPSDPMEIECYSRYPRREPLSPWRLFTGERRKCRQTGHIARYCPQNQPKRQGN